MEGTLRRVGRLPRAAPATLVRATPATLKVCLLPRHHPPLAMGRSIAPRGAWAQKAEMSFGRLEYSRLFVARAKLQGTFRSHSSELIHLWWAALPTRQAWAG